MVDISKKPKIRARTRGPLYDQVISSRINIRPRIGRSEIQVRPKNQRQEYEYIRDTTLRICEVVFIQGCIYRIPVQYEYELFLNECDLVFELVRSNSAT